MMMMLITRRGIQERDDEQDWERKEERCKETGRQIHSTKVYTLPISKRIIFSGMHRPAHSIRSPANTLDPGGYTRRESIH